jgi:hypothetical protein
VQTLSKRITGTIETLESLRWPKQRVGKGGVVTYFVQIIDQPYHIVALKVLHTLDVLPPIKYVTELIVEFGCGSVEAIELL